MKIYSKQLPSRQQEPTKGRTVTKRFEAHIDTAGEPASFVRPATGQLTPEQILVMQRTLGNQAVVRRMANRPQVKQSAPRALVQRTRGFNILKGDGVLKKTPNETAEAVPDGDLATGSMCMVLQEQSGWSRVRVAMLQGYLPSNLLASQPAPKEWQERENLEFGQGTGGLYGDTDNPQLTDVKQGNLSDCFLLAPLAAVAATPNGKTLIKGLFTETAEGFSIQLYDIDNEGIEEGTPITVDRWVPVTDEGQLEYCPGRVPMADNPPIWASMVEKAWAKDSEEKSYSGIEYQDTGTAMSQLTGQKTFSLRWNATSETMVAIPENGAENLWGDAYKDDEIEDADVQNMADDVLLQQLHTAKQNTNRAVVAETITQGEVENDALFLDEGLRIKDSHVYVVQSVDLEERTITLWDPAHNHPPNPLSIADFKRYFDRILKTDLSNL